MKSVLLCLLVTGCSSMIDSPCKTGYQLDGNSCVARTEVPDAGTHHPDAGDPDARVPHDGDVDASIDAPRDGTTDGAIDAAIDGGTVADAAIDAAPDAPPDAPPDAVATVDGPTDGGATCSLDVTSDPDNCGFCGHVCASGLCSASHCSGEPYGHIVAIGHDYAHFHASMARVIGNSVALGLHHDVGVGLWPESKNTQVQGAISTGTNAINRPWHQVPISTGLADVDVLVIDGASTEMAGTIWKATLDDFLTHGGVVVVVEGPSRTEHLFASGAGLFTSGEPVDVTNQALTLASPTDTVADNVLAPYLAEATTVSFPGLTPAVVATPDGSTVVFHKVR